MLSRLIVLSCCLLTSRLPAQLHADLPAGVRIRATAPSLDSTPLRGRISRFTDDSLALALGDGGAEVTLPAALILAVDESEGRERRKWALWGAQAGFVAGGLLLAHSVGSDDDLGQLVGFIAGGIVGTLPGAIAGYVYAPERWRRRFTELEPRSPTGRHRVSFIPDARIRYQLIASGARRRNSTVQSFANDTLVVEGEVAIPLSQLASAEVRGGRNVRRGIMYGVAIITGITAAGAIPDHSRGVIGTGEMMRTFFGNAVFGGLLGAAFAPKGWVRVPIPRSL